MGSTHTTLPVVNLQNEHGRASRPSFDSLDEIDGLPLEAPPPRPKRLAGLFGRFGLLFRDFRHNYLAMGLERRPARRGEQPEDVDLQGPEDSLLARGHRHDATSHSPRSLGRMKGITWLRLGAYQIITLPFFTLLLYGAYAASRRLIPPSNVPMTLYNGSSYFAPTTLIISLDGLRADFLHRGLTPTLNEFIQQGVSPRYMLPSFPSLTFPNHWTLATGLYPESHGIVANKFWDPEAKQEFSRVDDGFLQPRWWAGESFWTTAEKQGLRAAIHMWPGSEVAQEPEPAYVDKFNSHEPLNNKVNRILGFLDLPGRNDSSPIPNRPRPQLIAAYVPNIDAYGHMYGPNSTEIHDTIREVDSMLAQIFRGLKERNLTDIVNFIILSDHGMATTSTSRMIQIDDIIDMNKIEFSDGWPHSGLRPKNAEDLEPLYNQLKAAASTSGGFDVYLRDVDMPERYHFTHNLRIAPLWVLPHAGWAIVSRPHFDAEKARQEMELYHPRGLHGYDHEHPLMRAIFVARGPAFPHTPGSKVDVFHNIEVYNIVCDSLGIQPRPNNGTLRLPLQTKGKHTEPPPGEIPDEPDNLDYERPNGLAFKKASDFSRELR